MGLRLSEITPRAIGYFNTKLLNCDRALRVRSETTKTRPFVCLGATVTNSVWVALTSQPRAGGRDRLRIRERWRIGGDKRWLAGPSFLKDALYAGPSLSFVRAANEDRRWWFDGRPFLDDEGFAAVALHLMLLGVWDGRIG